MQITDALAQMGGLQSMARELGISEQEVAKGTEALAPAVLGGFKKQAQALPSGMAGLGGLLGQLGGSGLLDQVLGPQPTDVSKGNNVLGQIFGSKDVSRAVAQDASAKSGVATSVLKKMLPMLAMMVAGYMAKNRGDGVPEQAPSGGGGLGGLVGGLLGGQAGAAGQAAGSGGGLSGFASMLDLDGNGNPLDDILQRVGKGVR